jgi:opacity protein-like surface antigen
MKTIVLAASLAALLCSSAFAQDRAPRPGSGSKAQSSDQPGYAWRGYGSGHDAPYRAFNAADPREGLNSSARDEALRECSATSQKYAETT